MEILIKKKGLREANISKSQPLQVEHHRSFVVDLEALPNVEDVKCDDMGAWKNNSCHKFYFLIEDKNDVHTNDDDGDDDDEDDDEDDDDDDDDDDELAIIPTKDRNPKTTVILKRQYYSLRHDDVRKRIDIYQVSKFIYSCISLDENVSGESRKIQLSPGNSSEWWTLRLLTDECAHVQILPANL